MSKAVSARHQTFPKFAPLTLDFTFKKAFASKQSTELLLFLLNTFLAEKLKSPIKEASIINSEQLGKTRLNRNAIFDVYCEDATGTRFIVEMQVEEQEHFIKRSLFYLCMAVANIAKKGRMESKGKKIPYDYNIPAVYTLCFLSFDAGFGKGCEEVVQYISLSNELHPEVRYDILRMAYVRLSRFCKREEECKSDIDRLLFTLKNAHNLAKRPSSFNKIEFKHLFEIARISNFSEEELMNYEGNMKSFSDHANALAYAEKKGVARGEARGEARGMERGVAVGEAKGLEIAARNMLVEGMEPALVARYTKLPLKTVKALR